MPTGWIIANGQFVGPGMTISGSWSGVDFAGADLTGANITSPVDISRANFTGVNLTGATFAWASGPGANFTGANLTSANFAGGSYAGAIFVNATFTGATLRASVDMSNTSMAGATFTGASAQFGVLMDANEHPSGVFPSAWGWGSTGANVTCAPGVVTDNWASCFPRPARPARGADTFVVGPNDPYVPSGSRNDALR